MAYVERCPRYGGTNQGDRIVVVEALLNVDDMGRAPRAGVRACRILTLMLVQRLRTLVRALRRRSGKFRQRIQWFRDEVYVAPGAVVAKAAKLGRRVRVTGPSHIDPCEIGPYTTMSQVALRSANHHTEYLNMNELAQRSVIGGRSVLKVPDTFVKIGAACWLGDNAIVLEGVTIGDGAIVGAGAVVTKDVPPYAIVVGNPGRVIRYRFSDEVIELIKDVHWWNWSDTRLRANKELFEIDLTTVDPTELKEILAGLQ